MPPLIPQSLLLRLSLVGNKFPITSTPHKVIIFGSETVAEQQSGGSYGPLVVEIVKFFQTGVVPVAPEVTIELFAFMEAADESKRRGGVPVSIAEVVEKAGWPSDE